MLVMSSSPHKETRFLLILLPLYFMICLRGYDLTSRPLKTLAVVLSLGLFVGINVIGRTAPL